MEERSLTEQTDVEAAQQLLVQHSGEGEEGEREEDAGEECQNKEVMVVANDYKIKRKKAVIDLNNISSASNPEKEEAERMPRKRRRRFLSLLYIYKVTKPVGDVKAWI